ncbi:hypothetical protein M5K25_028467 [Dendrobium thyrsiflorum]|uniref:Uncharacterized protein n=1 Tax=Dendrobium thyrsiflorum TaxID=117978 RepID=A0ABD0TT70_DENTH
MSGRGASFVLMYGRELSLDDKYAPTYLGGSYRSLQVPANTNLEQLKFRVLRTLKYNTSKYTMMLVCHLPLGNELIASPVEDDEICEMVLLHAIGQILILYVEVEEINKLTNNAKNITPQVHESFSLEERVEVLSMIPPVEPQYIYERQCSQSQDVPRPFARLSLTIDDGYEPMSGGASEPVDDDDANLLCESMAENNDFVKTCMSTREWDEDGTYDSENIGYQVKESSQFQQS